MKELRLNSLRAFAATYQTGGVRAAATFLGVSHSAVSRHIKELEAWIGIPLLSEEAPRQRLTFTREGQRLGKAAADNLTSLEGVILSLKESRRSNSVVISTTASVAVRWLIPRLAAFQDTHRSIEVSVLTEQSISDPQSQGADLAIRMGRGPWAGFECEPFMDDALYPVIHPNLLDRSKRKKPDPFKKCPLIHDRDPAAAWHEWFKKHPNVSVDLRRGLRFTSSDLVLRAAAQKLGIALARDRLVADDILSGVLVRPFGDTSIKLNNAYWLVVPKHATLRSAVTIVIDWLRAEGAKTG